MNTAKEYIKTLLKLAINNNPEVLKVIRNSKTVVTNATEDAQGNLHSESNGQFVSKNNNKSFYNETTKTIELKGNELGFTDEEIRENGLKYFKENYQGKKFDNPELKGILFSRVGLNKLKSNSADIEKIKAIPALKDIVEKGKYMGSEDLAHQRQDGIIKFHRINHDVSINGQKENMSVLIGEDRDGNRFYNLNNKTYTVENSSRVIRAKGRADEEFLINIIPDFNENFNPGAPNMKKHEVQNHKEQDMALIDELKKLITKVENDKAACEQSAQRSAGTFNASNQGGEDMDDKEKVENEKVDKREYIRKIMALVGELGGTDEQVRTAAGWAEKISYDKSEAGTADNKKAKNEKEDEPKDDKPADNSKVKNESQEVNKKSASKLKRIFI